MQITVIKYLLGIVLFSSILSCAKEIESTPNSNTLQSTDSIEQYGLIGEWEIQSRVVNNITGMPALCCEFLVFSADQNTNYNIGNFSYFGNGDNTAGTFEVIDFDNMQFLIDGTVHYRSFAVNGNYLSLDYIESGDSISEIWIKQ